MAKGLSRSIRRADPQDNAAGFRRHRIVITNQTLTVAAAGAGVGFGNIAFGLPEGYLIVAGAGGFISISTTSTNITNAAFTGSASLGSTADADGTLASGDITYAAAQAFTAVAKVVASVKLMLASGAAAPQMVDNHTPNQSIFLNMIVTAADITDASSAPMTINGYIDVVLARLGDN